VREEDGSSKWPARWGAEAEKENGSRGSVRAVEWREVMGGGKVNEGWNRGGNEGRLACEGRCGAEF